MLLGCMAPRPCRKLRLCALLLLLLSELALQHAAARQEEEGEGEKPKPEVDGSYMTDSYKKNILEYAASLGRNRAERRRAAAPGQAFEPGWLQIGPDAARWQAQGNTHQNAGRVKKILQDPNNLNRVYVAFSAGGVWRSDNFFSQAPTWRALTDSAFVSVPTTSVGAMALGAADSKMIYLGLGDFFDVRPTLGGVVCTSLDATATEGVVFTADECKALPGQTAIRDIKVAPGAGLNRQDQVIVAASAGSWQDGDEAQGGMWVSRDAGQTYQAAKLGANCWSIAQTIIAGSVGWLAACTIDGRSEIWRSSNQGLTFTRIAATPFGPDAGRATLAVLSPGSNIVYALVAKKGADSGQYLDIFRSNGGGAPNTWTALKFMSKRVINPPPRNEWNNWTATTVGGTFWGAGDPIAQASFNQMLLVDPADRTGNTFFFGANLMSAKTTDGGRTFSVVSYWLDTLEQYGIPYNHADHHTAAYLLKPPAALQAPGSRPASMQDIGLPATGSGYGGGFSGIHQDADAAAAAVAAAETEGVAQAAANVQAADGTVEASAQVQQAGARVVVFGTDGGIFVSDDGRGGAMDKGEKNIGISTMLVDLIAATPLFPDLVAVGLQDNAVRSRVGRTTDWNAVSNGDGTGIAMSQAGNPLRACALGQTNWAGCPWRYNLSVLASNTNEILDTLIENNGAVCGTGTLSIIPEDSIPNRAAGFVVPPPALDRTGQTFYMKFARNIFRTKNCGNEWSIWAGVLRGTGLPAPVVQDTGDDDPCLDAGCDNTGSALWGGWGDSTGSITLGLHPRNILRAASLLFVSHTKDDPATPAIAITANDGASWTTQSFNVPNWFPRSTTSPTFSSDGRRLFVAYTAPGTGAPARILANNNPFAAGAAGAVWRPLPAAGLPRDVPVLRILAHPTIARTLFVANWLGVYVTFDGGLTFSRLGDDTDEPLPLVQVSDLAIIPRAAGGFVVRAGTRGRSVFEYDRVL
uniref:Sortilin N-terminal domain-containing protein n=1 Tax=Tetradesmus obliquus TaxID=3088 RepID=A0A383VAR7_TETOB|eukprot:jgi/Sobl393_1/3299/SZX61829.1